MQREPATLSSGAPSARADGMADFVIVLDCSGSMHEQTKDGSTKMEAAKKAVRAVVQNMGNGQRLAFLIYGHDRVLKCEAVKVVREMTPLDDARQGGTSPGRRCLAAGRRNPDRVIAANGCQRTGQRRESCGLVLVTDGLESCGGKPAAEAAALLSQNPNLKLGVNVIGLGVKPEEEASLKEIAEARARQIHCRRRCRGTRSGIEGGRHDQAGCSQRRSRGKGRQPKVDRTAGHGGDCRDAGSRLCTERPGRLSCHW